MFTPYHPRMVYLYIYHKNQPIHVIGKYTIPMDGMGADTWILSHFFPKTPPPWLNDLGIFAGDSLTITTNLR